MSEISSDESRIRSKARRLGWYFKKRRGLGNEGKYWLQNERFQIVDWDAPLSNVEHWLDEERARRRA